MLANTMAGVDITLRRFRIGLVEFFQKLARTSTRMPARKPPIVHSIQFEASLPLLPPIISITFVLLLCAEMGAMNMAIAEKAEILGMRLVLRVL
jgi:hypothetical protein